MVAYLFDALVRRALRDFVMLDVEHRAFSVDLVDLLHDRSNFSFDFVLVIDLNVPGDEIDVVSFNEGVWVEGIAIAHHGERERDEHEDSPRVSKELSPDLVCNFDDAGPDLVQI
jgi:hypothetical protein